MGVIQRLLTLTVLSVSLAGTAGARSEWVWQTQPHIIWDGSSRTESKLLNGNTGAFALDCQEYSDGGIWKLWTTVGVTFDGLESERLRARELSDLWCASGGVVLSHDEGVRSDNVAVAMNASRKHVAWARFDNEEEDWYLVSAYADLTDDDDYWTEHVHLRDGVPVQCYWGLQSIAQQSSGQAEYVYILYVSQDAYDIMCSVSADNGATWEEVQVWRGQGDLDGPSIAAVDGTGLVYALWSEWGDAYFSRSTDHGQTWSEAELLTYDAGYELSLCAIGDYVVAVFEGDEHMELMASGDCGVGWGSPVEVGLPSSGGRGYGHPNAQLLAAQDGRIVLLVSCEVRANTDSWSSVTSIFGWPTHSLGRWVWDWSTTWLTDPVDPYFSQWWPSLAVWGDPPGSGYDDTLAVCVYADPHLVQTHGHRLFRALADWREGGHHHPFPPVAVDQYGGGLGLVDGDAVAHATIEGQYVVSGPVLEEVLPAPVLVAPGWSPALAIDGDGQRWVAFLRDDTVWCMMAQDTLAPVFCGSSSARPGQPSLAVYPGTASGAGVGAATFAVYDSGSATSMIVFVKFDTGQVVLDTVHSLGDLRDSLPCINIAKTDSVFITWQSGDSIAADKLLDYGATDWSRPPAWSGFEVVAASGSHPMSWIESEMLHSVWTTTIEDTAEGQDTVVVGHATCDVSGQTIICGWTEGAAASERSPVEKANPVYAGAGVTVWQEKVDGTWCIRGAVRGDTVTFVANDTNAYCPHALVESSYVSPSVSQVRVRQLYLADRVVEVDSAEYDTVCQAQYRVDSLNVSNATADATQSNNGAKLIRPPGGDSLLAVYADAENAVMYAWTAAGDSWRREVLDTDCDCPAIAQDSAGGRWAVVRRSTCDWSRIDGYLRDGTSWDCVGEFYHVDQPYYLGPPSLAAISDSSASRAYVAFRQTSNEGQDDVIIVIGFDDHGQFCIDSLMEAQGLGDPCIAVEPVSADSDRVHVCWTKNGEVRYTYNTETRSATGFQAGWASHVELSGSSGTAVHPVIGADRERVVVAWAQGSTPDVYSRWRSTDSAYDNWEDTLNLSKTASAASDYPTVALGDSVIVAWEEHRSGTDYDVLICVEFDDTLSVADNATRSSYPHVLFQNTTSGDTAIPYVHVIWSETPMTDYYEVDYHRENLKQTGGGQQSAAVLPGLPPRLEACRPNPFSGRTAFAYQFPQAGRVSLAVYDASGRVVRVLQEGEQAPGRYTATWDGRDVAGRSVANGVYFYRLDVPGYRDVKKAVVMR